MCRKEKNVVEYKMIQFSSLWFFQNCTNVIWYEKKGYKWMNQIS